MRPRWIAAIALSVALLVLVASAGVVVRARHARDSAVRDAEARHAAAEKSWFQLRFEMRPLRPLPTSGDVVQLEAAEQARNFERDEAMRQKAPALAEAYAEVQAAKVDLERLRTTTWRDFLPQPLRPGAAR